MKYLKGYKLFEFKGDNLIKDIEEVFYSISDRYTINIIDYSIYYQMDNRIRISISGDKDEYKLIDNYNIIRDDLEFAIRYLINELKLKYISVDIYHDCNILMPMVSKLISFNSFDDLVGYNKPINSIRRLDIYFSWAKKISG